MVQDTPQWRNNLFGLDQRGRLQFEERTSQHNAEQCCPVPNNLGLASHRIKVQRGLSQPEGNDAVDVLKPCCTSTAVPLEPEKALDGGGTRGREGCFVHTRALCTSFLSSSVMSFSCCPLTVFKSREACSSPKSMMLCVGRTMRDVNSSVPPTKKAIMWYLSDQEVHSVNSSACASRQFQPNHTCVKGWFGLVVLEWVGNSFFSPFKGLSLLRL